MPAENYLNVICHPHRKFAQKICKTLGMAPKDRPKNNERFARIVAESFAALGIAQTVSQKKFGGPSDATLRKIMAGEPVGISIRTLKNLDAAFQWTPGSAA